jgi:phospholipid transport system substrate-binding protein
VSVDWRIRRIDNQYKIFDVVAEGVSMGIALRSEYTSILQQHGGHISALTEQMRRKNAEQAMAR